VYQTKDDMKKETLDFMIWIEEQMDNYNGENGTVEELCCFCGTKEYNTTLGILHKKDCHIIKFRKDIAEAKTQTD